MSDIAFNVNGSDSIDVVVTNGDTVEMTVTDSAPIEIEVNGGRGEPGVGVPPGGLVGQQLTKTGAADYATGWTDAELPAGIDKEVQFNDAGDFGADSNFKWDKNTKTLRLGIADDEPLPDNPLAIVGAVDTYLQAAIKNSSETEAASSDWVATADNGNDDLHYIDMGINSSVYAVDGDATGPNDGYVDIEGGDLFLITETPGTEIPIIVGGSDDAARVAAFTENGLRMESGKSITNRPEIFYGTGSTPSPVGKADGTLFFKYTP